MKKSMKQSVFFFKVFFGFLDIIFSFIVVCGIGKLSRLEIVWWCWNLKNRNIVITVIILFIYYYCTCTNDLMTIRVE